VVLEARAPPPAETKTGEAQYGMQAQWSQHKQQQPSTSPESKLRISPGGVWWAWGTAGGRGGPGLGGGVGSGGFSLAMGWWGGLGWGAMGGPDTIV